MKSRRTFLKNGCAAVAGSLLLNKVSWGNTANQSRDFGFEVWTIRQELMNDFSGTLKKMAGMGYHEVEMCSPLGYSKQGFEPLNKLSGKELRNIIEDSGIKCTSSHYNMGELRDHLDNRIAWAKDLGMEQMIIASFGLPQNAVADDYRRAADELNNIGKKTKEAGIQVGFHNHHGEFEKRGNDLIYDILLEQLDPDLVKMQFQVAVIDIGYKAADYFKKYPGRFISAHLADYSVKDSKQVPIGDGIVDWNEFFDAAKIGGVKNFYVEMDPEYFKPSADFLKRHLK